MQRKRNLRIKGLLCLFLTFILLVGSLSGTMLAAGSDISTATVSWHSSMGDATNDGYTLSGDTLTIKPFQNTEQTVMLQIAFALTNGCTADAGEIEIRISQSIFYDSNGNSVGDFYLPLSMNDEGITSFKYYIDDATDEIVITNYKTVESGSVFSCNIEYKFLPSDVEDGYLKNDIAATFTYTPDDGTVPESVTSNNLTVAVDTGASIQSLKKASYLKYETWLSVWGSEPDDSADYFYIAWLVTYEAPDNCTEAYSVTFSDNPGSNAKVMGYAITANAHELQAESEISIVVAKPETNVSTVRYYVVVAYDRSILSTDATPTLKNEITATLTEDCGETESVTTEAQYKYQILNINYVDSFYVLKYASGASMGIINTIEEGNSGVLGSMRNSETYSFQIESNARGWGLTEDNGNYGEKEYTVDLLDESLSIDGVALNNDDYEITSWWIDYTEYSGGMETSTGGYQFDAITDYTSYSPVEIYVKTVNGIGNWELVGEVIKTASGYEYTDKCTATTDYSGSFSKGKVQIQLPAGTYAVKFSHSNSRFYTQIRAYLTVSLNPTTHVESILSEKTSALLTNIVRQEVSKADGTLVKRSSGSDSMQLTKLVANSKLSKSTPTKTSNAAGYEILKYNVSMYESTVYTPNAIANDNVAALQKLIDDGIVAEQTDGIFCDLLPAGTTVDPSSIHVVTYGNEEVCAFVVDVIENWQNSGQTMLIIEVMAPSGLNYYDIASGNNRILYSGFNLSYNLIYTWVNYHDYGGDLLNSIAYWSTTGKLSDGDTAINSTIEKKEYFSDLDNDGVEDDTNKNTIYAQNDSLIAIASAAEVGFSKAVKAADELLYRNSSVVPVAGTYTYQLRYGTDIATGDVSNLVFYDVLETYLSGDAEQWKGTLIEVDTTYAKSKGIDAIVYYSTVSGLDPEHNLGHADLTDSIIWSTTPPSDLSLVTAVAVDMSKNQNGTDKVFTMNEAALCYITMRAPEDYERWKGVYAYNSAYCGHTLTSNSGDPVATITECNHVQVGLRDVDIVINKSSNPVSGTATIPTKVNVGDTIDYTVSIKNTNTAEALDKVEISDIIPDGLTIDTSQIQYYIGTNAEAARPYSELNGISVTKTNQTLVFVIDKLMAGESISFIIPAGVVANGAVFENTATITKINNCEFEIDSETTYHKTDNQPVTLQLNGTKNLKGRTLVAGEFSFVLKDNAGVTVETVSNLESGSFNFSTLTFSNPGRYEYSVEEVSGTLGGIIYDTIVYNVTITVADDGAGNLTATPSYAVSGNSVSTIEFNNTYNANSTSVALAATKNLEGKDLEANMFSFVVKDENGDVVSTATNNAEGAINFGVINYTVPGTYNYTVSEVNGGASGTTYDDVEYSVTISISDNGRGQLVATVTYNDGDIVFNNTYNADSTRVALTGKKELTGMELMEGMFSFIVKDGNETIVSTGINSANGTIDFGEIGFDKAGIYTYTVSEIAGSAEGISYDMIVYTVTINVIDNGVGQLVVSVTYPGDGIVFNNVYATTDSFVNAIVDGTKVLMGKVLEADMFCFIVTDDDNNGAIVSTDTNNEDGTIHFMGLTYTEADIGTYHYTVKEINNNVGGITYDSTEYHVTVEVRDNGSGHLETVVTYEDGNIVFNNTYNVDSTSVALAATKNLEGKTLEANMFSFVVKDENGDVVATATNSADGSINFGAMNYTAPGTYNYTVSEVNGGTSGTTYDDAEYGVTIAITDNGMGQLVATVTYNDGDIVFNNTYNADSTSVALTGKKELIGMELMEGMFSFIVKDENGAIVSTGINSANGTINFGEIGFDKAGIYTFTVTEINNGVEAITYDSTVYTITVTVNDNGSGTLSVEVTYPKDGIVFTNKYSAGDTSNPDTSSPATGDNGNIFLWSILSCCTLAAGTVLTWLTRRRRYH